MYLPIVSRPLSLWEPYDHHFNRHHHQNENGIFRTIVTSDLATIPKQCGKSTADTFFARIAFTSGVVYASRVCQPKGEIDCHDS